MLWCWRVADVGLLGVRHRAQVLTTDGARPGRVIPGRGVVALPPEHVLVLANKEHSLIVVA